MRKWLNSAFINSAFNSQEQGKILRKRIKNFNNTKYGTRGGPDTEDKIFLLSINETVRYFPSNDARKPVPTAYTVARGGLILRKYGGDDGEELYSSRNNIIISWWLRSPGYTKDSAANIDYNGELSYAGSPVNVATSENRGDGLVRPALWLDVSK